MQKVITDTNHHEIMMRMQTIDIIHQALADVTDWHKGEQKCHM